MTSEPSFGGRIGDPRLRSVFALDSDETAWLGVLRRAGESVALGTLGPYELLEEAGRGAQGAVYKASHRRTRRIVALKRLPLAGAVSPRARARFEREIEAACALDHPGIVTVYSAEVIDGHAVIAMEWVNGCAIDRWAAQGPRSSREIASMCAEVCDAVAHAHQRGVIHRDLKPCNIMAADDGRPRVLDFGLAKVAEENGAATLTQSAGFLGTPAYAAPEQVVGEPADTRSDVYALGVILYELLVGKHPFDTGVPVAEMFDQVRRGIARPPSAVNPGIGRELDAIVLKATALEPDQRYPSAEAMASDLRRYLHGDTVLAHPPSAMYRLRKLAARHRAWVAVTGGGILALIVFVAVVTALAVRLAGERKKLVAALGSEHAALLESQGARQAEARAREAADGSAAQAQAASKQAEAEARHAQSGLEFLRGVLEEAGGQRGYQINVPMRDVLAKAVAQLDAGAVADQPQSELDLRITIGLSYRSLGVMDGAETQFRRVLELSERVYGARSREAGRAWNLLGRVVELGGRPAEAEAYQRRSLEVVAGIGDASYYAGIQSDLASTLDEQGRYAEAEAVYADALAFRLGQPNRDEIRLGTLYRNIGLEQLEQGRYEQAEANTGIALELLAPIRHDTDPELRARRNLARIYQATGRTDEAIAIMSGVLAVWSKQLGADHPQIAREEAIFAGMLADAGRDQEAIRLYGSAIAGLEGRLSPSHPWPIRARLALARTYLHACLFDVAEAIGRATLAQAIAGAAGTERLIFASASGLADCLIAQGRIEQGAAVVSDAAAQLCGRLSPGDPLLRRCIQVMSQAAAARGAPASDCP